MSLSAVDKETHKRQTNTNPSVTVTPLMTSTIFISCQSCPTVKHHYWERERDDVMKWNLCGVVINSYLSQQYLCVCVSLVYLWCDTDTSTHVHISTSAFMNKCLHLHCCGREPHLQLPWWRSQILLWKEMKLNQSHRDMMEVSRGEWVLFHISGDLIEFSLESI